MTKKICISGYYGFDNFGDETILSVLVEKLKTIEPKPQITVFSSNPEKTSKKLEVNSVYTFNLKAVFKEIIKCDCLISGGGSLLQDITSVKSLIYYLLVIASAKISGKKVIIFAQGIGPIKNTLLKLITMQVLKYADNITVRDENSLKLLQKYNIKAQLCSDPVWNINVKKETKQGKIGVQLRDFHNITDEFLDKLANCINKYYQDKEICLLSLQNKSDIKVLMKLKDKLSAVNPDLKTVLIENTSDEKVIKDIAQMQELIAMRYHACLIAIKAGVKVLPINYDIKVETLSNDFNLKYINIENDFENSFEQFYNSEIKYDEAKLNSLYFDFKLLEKYINC